MAADFIAEGRATLATLAQHKGEDAKVIAREVSIGLDALEQATQWLIPPKLLKPPVRPAPISNCSDRSPVAS
jgi:hypothetical protein